MNGWNAGYLCNWTPIHSCVHSSVICSLGTLTECLLWIPFCLSALQSFGSVPSLSHAPSYLKAFPDSLSSAWGHSSCNTPIPCWDLSSNLAYSELGLLTIPTWTPFQMEVEPTVLSTQSSWIISLDQYLLIPLNCKPCQGSSCVCVSHHASAQCQARNDNTCFQVNCLLTGWLTAWTSVGHGSGFLWLFFQCSGKCWTNGDSALSQEWWALAGEVVSGWWVRSSDHRREGELALRGWIGRLAFCERGAYKHLWRELSSLPSGASTTLGMQ